MDLADLEQGKDLRAQIVRAQAIAAVAVVVAICSLAAAIFALSRTNSPTDGIEETAASRDTAHDAKLDELSRRLEQIESDSENIRAKLDTVEERLHP